MRKALLFLLPALLLADAGVLVPTNLQPPRPEALTLDEMAIDIWVDNGMARVLTRQIWGSHVGQVLEGNYSFALPARALVSDFAVWDDVVRIPGVILERKRAGEIYTELRNQAIDPGLLQMGERGPEEARRGSVFSAHIVPVPAFGTKRIELEYHERIPVEQLASQLAIPLRPEAFAAQRVGHLWITLEMRSEHDLAGVEFPGKTYPMQIREQTPKLVRAVFEGRNVTLSEDFAVRYRLDPARADRLQILAHHDDSPAEPGFFEASTLVAPRDPGSANSPSAPRTIVAVFDVSLSMQWEKLERSFQALESTLRALKATDRFSLILFNSQVTAFAQQPVAAEPATVERALEFVRASRLRGGTDLGKALEAALALANGPNTYLLLLTDGGATQGTIQTGKLADAYAKRWSAMPDAQRPRTYVFGVGDDANLPLLRMLARNDGLFEWVRSTEPVEFKLSAFLSKIGRRPLDKTEFSVAPGASVDMVYALEDTVFPGSEAAWVGQYKAPSNARFTARAQRDGLPLVMTASAALPARAPEHPQLPRTWAKARVDALLERIERDGEDRASIDEIIRLSRKYKFVTPYTSFLAAPRALLRPRLIRPGDPVLRVRTDPSISGVTALFPFGEVKALRYLAGEDIWQTRFLAPADMTDGTYQVRLVLRDRQGRVYRESKSFVIASKPPVVRVKLDKARYRPNEAVKLRVSASSTTRTVTARLYGASSVRLHWNPEMASNTGELFLPATMPAGRYVLTVTAEDFAHNIGSQEVPLEVLP